MLEANVLRFFVEHHPEDPYKVEIWAWFDDPLFWGASRSVVYLSSYELIENPRKEQRDAIFNERVRLAKDGVLYAERKRRRELPDTIYAVVEVTETPEWLPVMNSIIDRIRSRYKAENSDSQDSQEEKHGPENVSDGSVGE